MCCFIASHIAERIQQVHVPLSEHVDAAVLRSDDEAAGGDGGRRVSAEPASNSDSFLPRLASST